MTIAALTCTAARAADQTARPARVNPFPEDEVAQPTRSTTTTTKTTAPPKAAVKSGRNLIWRSAEPTTEVETAPQAEPVKAAQPTPAKPPADVPKTVSVKVDAPAASTAVEAPHQEAPAKPETTRIQVVVDGDKGEARVEPVVNLAGTKSVMAQPAQFIAPAKEPTAITAEPQPTPAPTLRPALPGHELSTLPEASHHEVTQPAATKVSVKAKSTAAVRQVAEDLPIPSRGAALRMQSEPNMLPPGNLPPGNFTPGPYTEPAPSAQPPQTSNSPMTQYDSCEEANSKCQAAWDKVKANVIADIDLSIAPHALSGGAQAIQGRDYPCECVLPRGTFEGRCWQPSTFEWLASAVCYKPLYFEESSLERYGHTHHPFIQPFVSGAHFFGTFPILPYKMGVETPCECIYPLGTYRPGDCAPRICEGVPLSIRGALFETGAVLGAVYIIP